VNEPKHAAAEDLLALGGDGEVGDAEGAGGGVEEAGLGGAATEEELAGS
jgi:hypothetical protein